MSEKAEAEATLPAGSDEAKPDVAQTSDTKAEATSTAKASDELSEDDLEAVAGGSETDTRDKFRRLVAEGLTDDREHPDRSPAKEISCFWLAASAVESGNASYPALGRNPAPSA